MHNRKDRAEDKIWVLLLLVLLVLATYIGIRFDVKEATVINGNSIELNNGWETNDGGQINLPHAFIPQKNSKTIISINIPSEYAGFMLEVPVNNATVTVAVNRNPVYEGSSKTAATYKKNDNMIYLPDYGHEGKLEISLQPIDNNSSMYIRGVSVTRGDTAIIRQIKGSLYELLCCIAMFLCSVVIAILEIIRKKSGWEEYNLQRFALFAIAAFTMNITASQMPVMFFGNEEVFTELNNTSMVTLPVLLYSYYCADQRGYKRKEIITSGILAAASVIMAAICLYKKTEYPVIRYMTYILLAYVSVDSLLFAIKAKRNKWGLEFIWLLILIAYSVQGITVQKEMSPAILGTILITTALSVAAIWQTTRLVADYREIVERSEQEAIRANEAKGAFLANMSHEIRTPINAVLGMDEMILRESTEQEIRNYAMDIRSAGRTLLSIINDILDLSKIESGKMEIVATDYDSAGLIRDTVNLITPKVEEKNLRFITKIDPSLPAGLHGDDIRIRQIMTNLLSNAVKYTEKGKVGLQIDWEKIDEEEGILHCEVKDTGVGIKKEDIPKLFEKYTRFDEALHKHTEGTGLGMSITMQMLNLMDGKLDIKSKYGKGSVFRIALKQKITDKTPIGKFEDRAKIHTDDFEYTYTLYAPKAKMLVVDDNAMNRKVFVSLLKGTQIKIHEAGSGKECLKMIKDSRYDIIFMDHLMPEMDGVETFKRIRKLETPCKDTPVVILTANALVGDKEKYINKGFDGYLSKPVITEELNRIITDLLPEEMVAKKEVAKAVKEESATVDIDGIDANYIKLHFKDKQMQTMALKEFYRGAKIQINKLNALYRDIEKKEVIDEYRICVHAMKSSAATIGEIELFGLAKTLEYAAKDYNEEIIDALHLIYADKWKTFSKNLGKALGYKEKQKKKAMDPQISIALLSNLDMSMEIMDVDAADRIIKIMSAYDYGENAILFEQLKIAVNDLDIDKAKEAIVRIKEVL